MSKYTKISKSVKKIISLMIFSIILGMNTSQLSASNSFIYYAADTEEQQTRRTKETSARNKERQTRNKNNKRYIDTEEAQKLVRELRNKQLQNRNQDMSKELRRETLRQSNQRSRNTPDKKKRNKLQQQSSDNVRNRLFDDRNETRSNSRKRSEIRFNLDQAVSSVRNRTKGKVIKAYTRSENGNPVHYVRVLTDNKRVRTYRVDARNGRLL